MYMHVGTYTVYVYVLEYVCTCMLVWEFVYVCAYEYVIGCTCEFNGECVSQLQHTDSFVRFGLRNERLEFVFTEGLIYSNLKIDPWEDLEIRTGSCSEDQTAIRFQTRVISGELVY